MGVPSDKLSQLKETSLDLNTDLPTFYMSLDKSLGFQSFILRKANIKLISITVRIKQNNRYVFLMCLVLSKCSVYISSFFLPSYPFIPVCSLRKDQVKLFYPK